MEENNRILWLSKLNVGDDVIVYGDPKDNMNKISYLRDDGFQYHFIYNKKGKITSIEDYYIHIIYDLDNIKESIDKQTDNVFYIHQYNEDNLKPNIPSYISDMNIWRYKNRYVIGSSLNKV